jgi:YegS/Rv2252/BmrU family lipid kinase
MNIAFIVNPVSGTHQKEQILTLIPKVFGQGEYVTAIYKTEFAGHATQLASELANKHDIVVAVGGDGTLNEVAQGLIGTKAKLSVVPCGSGNGLARHLKIPINPRKALLAIRNGTEHDMDMIYFNGIPFLNLSGIGFDAQVAHNFSESAKRGLLSYMRSVVNVYFKFNPVVATISINGQTLERKILLIAFANSSQFGNNAVISPISEVNDGLMEVCIMQPFPFFAIPVVIARMFTRTMHKCRFIEIIQTQKASITTQSPAASHVDGNPFDVGNRFEVELVHKALKIVF